MVVLDDLEPSIASYKNTHHENPKCFRCEKGDISPLGDSAVSHMILYIETFGYFQTKQSQLSLLRILKLLNILMMRHPESHLSRILTSWKIQTMMIFQAQKGFARLMGLEDLTPLTTENEGLDSGLGDGLATSDKKIHSSTDNLEPDLEEITARHKTRGNKKLGKLEDSSVHPAVIPDETEYQPLRKSSRNKRKKDLKTDKILDQKRRKSLEKVAEWLMKVPTEGSLEMEKLDEDADDSDSCSSTSTIDVKQHISDINAKREDRAKALEEQVFGAVYRRDRRGNRNTSLVLDVVEPPVSTTQKTGSDLEREQQLIEDVNDTSSDIFTEAERVEVVEENGNDKYGEELNDSVKNKGKDEVPFPSPVAEIEHQQQQLKEGQRKECVMICSRLTVICSSMLRQSQKALSKRKLTRGKVKTQSQKKASLPERQSLSSWLEFKMEKPVQRPD
ncbi:hypothetical protein INR49_013729 [Caranx melampygus]|nr:hypothetical protein INR49_013729 [Caranx melampygus]